MEIQVQAGKTIRKWDCPDSLGHTASWRAANRNRLTALENKDLDSLKYAY